MKHARQLLFSILLFLSVIASAQNTDLYITVDPIDAITESTLTEARVSLLNPTDSTEVDTFRRLKIIGDMIPRYTFVYENKQTTLPFKYIVRIENEGYETSYANLSILPSEEKQGEVIRDMGTRTIAKNNEAKIRRVGRICNENHDGHEGRHSGL